MKYLIIIIIIFSSCSSDKVIISKDYKTDYKCICNYTYLQFANNTWFQDSCNKYNIGDIIK